ncbi:MAG: DUF86 domain-containing protein [Candidatus Brockarchaeota archaeon]|nr:DUF86 domain-containing protein [Candidatus Brockarchaeota archaeon]
MSKIDVMRVRRILSEVREAKKVIGAILERTKDEFLTNTEARYAARYAIVEMVEGAALAGSHVLEAKFGIVSESYTEVFSALAKKGVISPSVGESLRRMTGLRNLVVHRYWEVDDSRIYDEAGGSGLGAVEKFIEEVSGYVEKEDA